MGSVCDVNLTLPVLPSTEINKHNMRHYSMPSKRLVAEMRADGRDVSLRRNACLRARCLSPQHALAVSQASSKEEQVGVTRCAKENEIN